LFYPGFTISENERPRQEASDVLIRAERDSIRLSARPNPFEE
jgi:hypothetical protein